MAKIFIKTGDPKLVNVFRSFDKMKLLRRREMKLQDELQLCLVHHKYCIPADSTDENKVEINAKRLAVLRQIFRVMVDEVFAKKPFNKDRNGFYDGPQPEQTNKDLYIRRWRIEGPDADGVYEFAFNDMKAGDPPQQVRMSLCEMRALINYAVPRITDKDRYYSPWYDSTTVCNWEQEPIDDTTNESAGSQQ